MPSIRQKPCFGKVPSLIFGDGCRASLLTLVLLFVVNSPHSTALADGGTAGIVPVLQITFTKPAPAYLDWFGASVAALGSERALVGSQFDDSGATNAGAVYLFSTNGALLNVFTNPSPALGDNFGNAVAAVGNNLVLVGARLKDTGATNAGAAYLFSTNGAVLTVFTNPTPTINDTFGVSVAAVESDRVLIGADGDRTGAVYAGAAYLFSTNGTLITTFTNPTPAVGGGFGISVRAVGSGHVIIGTGNAEAAYLFNINGTLLTTFTNPTPAESDYFGHPVAAVGIDRVLIAATYDDSVATDAGAVYLFSTNGALLTTFTNPTPAADVFGSSVVAVGKDRVVIGASYDDSGATDTGAAYLFSTNGTLLATIANPKPSASALFGYSLTSLGDNHVLIGALWDDAGATAAGATYLFDFVPSLNIQRTSTNTIAVSWPLLLPDYTLQQNTIGIATAGWSNITDAIQDDGTNKYFIVEPATGNRFFRLSKP